MAVASINRIDWDDVFHRAATQYNLGRASKVTSAEVTVAEQSFLNNGLHLDIEYPAAESLESVEKDTQTVIESWLLETNEIYREACLIEHELVRQATALQQSVNDYRDEMSLQRSRETMSSLIAPPNPVPKRRWFGNPLPDSKLSRMDIQFENMLNELRAMRQTVVDAATNRKRIELTSLHSRKTPAHVSEAVAKLQLAQGQLIEYLVNEYALPFLRLQFEVATHASVPREQLSSSFVEERAEDSQAKKSALQNAELATTVSADGPGDKKSVFLVHGRDVAAATAMKELLRSMHLQVVEWDHAINNIGQPAPYVGDVVLEALRLADAVIVLFTPDDIVTPRRDLSEQSTRLEQSSYGQARPNVIYEAGIADALAASRTVLVQIGRVERFSDISGRHVLEFDGGVASRHRLAIRLKKIGLTVDQSGTDWQVSGDFTKGIVASADFTPPFLNLTLPEKNT